MLRARDVMSPFPYFLLSLLLSLCTSCCCVSQTRMHAHTHTHHGYSSQWKVCVMICQEDESWSACVCVYLCSLVFSHNWTWIQTKAILVVSHWFLEKGFWFWLKPNRQWGESSLLEFRILQRSRLGPAEECTEESGRGIRSRVMSTLPGNLIEVYKIADSVFI